MRGSILRAEFNSKKLCPTYFHPPQVNTTYKCAKEIFDCDRMLNRMLFGMSVCIL